jgi:hypothetical protein
MEEYEFRTGRGRPRCLPSGRELGDDYERLYSRALKSAQPRKQP